LLHPLNALSKVLSNWMNLCIARTLVTYRTTLRSSALLVGLLAGIGSVVAQLEIPTRSVLDGQNATERQVLGLGDPLTTDAAVSLEAARSTTANIANVSGVGSLTGILIPAPSSYTPGMEVTIVPTQANAAAATLDLNGLGPRLILKTGGVTLASSDLVPGTPVRLIYDGEYFQLLSSTQLPCPAGFTAATREYCIADSSDAAISFFSAAVACSARGARLCTISEWAHACFRIPGFLSTVTTAEWVDHAANNAATAKVAGAGNNGEVDIAGTGCNYGGWGLPANPFRFRCCANR